MAARTCRASFRYVTTTALKNTESPRRRPQRTRDTLLAVLALAAGSVDALSWLALGKVFSAFMTGNLVFLAVGVSSDALGMALRAAVALGTFGAGAWITASLMPPEQPGVLWPARVTLGLLGCATMQLVFWFAWLVVGGHPDPVAQVLLLGISAFAMGMQTAAAVALGVHAVFTTAATATWTVLVGDTARWSATRTERHRLTLMLAGTLFGALAGALLLTHARLWMPLLPMLLTGGVAVVAHRTIEAYEEPDRSTVSAAPHPLTRGFGRSPGKGKAVPGGR
jgi:uncharacterized membrane protein YoaK (UPF0700 family)